MNIKTESNARTDFNANIKNVASKMKSERSVIKDSNGKSNRTTFGMIKIKTEPVDHSDLDNYNDMDSNTEGLIDNVDSSNEADAVNEEILARNNTTSSNMNDIEDMIIELESSIFENQQNNAKDDDHLFDF